jgi:hypothetical protein
LPILDDGAASPASRRLASARPAHAPKCTGYFDANLKLYVNREVEGWKIAWYP